MRRGGGVAARRGDPVGFGATRGTGRAAPVLSSSPSSSSSAPARIDSGTAALLTSMMWPHLRHFIFDVARCASFSSAILYFALHCGQRNFMRDSQEA